MSISRKDRFKVFRRDGFRCQYCGRTHPDVLLEVDHIISKKDGGKDEMDNLITACYDCNQGKNALSVEEMNELVELRERQTDNKIHELEIVCAGYCGRYMSYEFTENTLRKFLHFLPYKTVKEAFVKSTQKMICEWEYDDENEEEQKKAFTSCLKYFCGICWNHIRREGKENG